MGRMLYLIAFLLVILWAIGYLGYNTGPTIHVLLVLALIAVLTSVIRGNKPFLGQY